MKQYLMYVCEKCGFTSRKSQDVESCEAGHLALSVEEYKHYKDLQVNAERCGRITSICKNEMTDAAFDKAIQVLLTFEKEHSLTNCM